MTWTTVSYDYLALTMMRLLGTARLSPTGAVWEMSDSGYAWEITQFGSLKSGFGALAEAQRLLSNHHGMMVSGIRLYL